MRKYKLGMIGNGGFGRFCAEVYNEMEEIEIAAVAATEASKVEEFAKDLGIPLWTTDYREILNNKEIDLVTIMTPPHLHCQMAVEAAKAGKAFLVEKPLALSLEEAKTIISAAQDNKVAATIGYVMRYSPLYDKVRQITQSSKFGRLKRMIFENYASGILPDNHWLFDQSKSGGLLVEHGVHFFDIFNSIVGQEFKQAKSYTPSPRETLAIVEYPNNIIATFYHAFDKPSAIEKNGAKFIYEKGYVEIDGWIPMAIRLQFENEAAEIVIEEEKIELSKDGEYRRLVKEVMLDLLKRMDNPLHEPKVTLSEARDSLELAIAARDHSIFNNLFD